MQYVADLHLHSKYSRAVSPQMTLPVMAQYAQLKGLDIITVSDFTHPVWYKEISNQLEETQAGLYQLKDQKDLKLDSTGFKSTNNNSKIVKETLFLLSTEISSIYKQEEKLRRIHNLVFAPNLEIAEKINTELVKRGCNLSADGRPIIGLTAKNLLELILSIDEKCFLIPCHVWTPHFGLYGSASGFDSIEEAFGEYSKYIYGVETGLSSDPDMNWSVKELMNRSILSFSDAHSLLKMGREATVFELETVSYGAIKKAIMSKAIKRIKKDTGDKRGMTSGSFDSSVSSSILYTIEFYPEEGKYHFSGHRNCKISYGPEQIEQKGTVCPVCHRRMTEGVLYRVRQLTDSALKDRVEVKKNDKGLVWHTDNLRIQPPYVKLVPLLEIVAESMDSTVSSQKVKNMYYRLCNELSSEIDVLLKIDIRDISRIGGERIAQGIKKIRGGNIAIIPGYDGEYGKVKIWEGEEYKKEEVPQLAMEF